MKQEKSITLVLTLKVSSMDSRMKKMLPCIKATRLAEKKNREKKCDCNGTQYVNASFK